MGGMKKKMKAGGGIKKMTAGGPTAEGTKMRRIGAGMEDRDAVTKKFSERGTSGAAEARKQKGDERQNSFRFR